MIVKDLLEEINADYFLNFKKELNSNFRRHYKYKLNDEDREKINNDLTKTLSYLKELKEVNTDSNLVIVPNVDLIENSLIYNIGFLKNKDVQNYNSVCFQKFHHSPFIPLIYLPQKLYWGYKFSMFYLINIQRNLLFVLFLIRYLCWILIIVLKKITMQGFLSLKH